MATLAASTAPGSEGAPGAGVAPAESRVVSTPVTIIGRIGDYCRLKAKYEINGTIYRLPYDIDVLSPTGQRLSIRDLSGGDKVRIIGEEVEMDGRPKRINYLKVILLENH